MHTGWCQEALQYGNPSFMRADCDLTEGGVKTHHCMRSQNQPQDGNSGRITAK